MGSLSWCTRRNVKTIEDVSKFLKLSPKNNIKTLAYMAAVARKNGAEVLEKPLVAFLRGDHMLNEAKLAGRDAGGADSSDACGGD